MGSDDVSRLVRRALPSVVVAWVLVHGAACSGGAQRKGAGPAPSARASAAPAASAPPAAPLPPVPEGALFVGGPGGAGVPPEWQRAVSEWRRVVPLLHQLDADKLPVAVYELPAHPFAGFRVLRFEALKDGRTTSVPSFGFVKTLTKVPYFASPQLGLDAKSSGRPDLVVCTVEGHEEIQLVQIQGKSDLTEIHAAKCEKLEGAVTGLVERLGSLPAQDAIRQGSEAACVLAAISRQASCTPLEQPAPAWDTKAGKLTLAVELRVGGQSGRFSAELAKSAAGWDFGLKALSAS